MLERLPERRRSATLLMLEVLRSPLLIAAALFVAAGAASQAPLGAGSIAGGTGVLLYVSAAPDLEILAIMEYGGDSGGFSIHILDEQMSTLGGHDTFLHDGAVWFTFGEPSLGVDLHERAALPPGKGPGARVIVPSLCTQSCYVLIWSAGAVDSLGYTLTAPVGASAEVVARYDRTLFDDGRDVADAHEAQLHTLPAMVTYQRGGQQTIHNDGRLYGYVGAGSIAAYQESVVLSGPDGSMTCPCAFLSLTEGPGPGVYHITRDATGVRPSPARLAYLLLAPAS